jgi:hypothetical protein
LDGQPHHYPPDIVASATGLTWEAAVVDPAVRAGVEADAERLAAFVGDALDLAWA